MNHIMNSGPRREEKSRDRRDDPRGMSLTPVRLAEAPGPRAALKKAPEARFRGWFQRWTSGGPPARLATSELFTHTATRMALREVSRQSYSPEANSLRWMEGGGGGGVVGAWGEGHEWVASGGHSPARRTLESYTQATPRWHTKYGS